MAEESAFNDLDYGLDPDHTVLSDHNLDDESSESPISYNKVPDSEFKDDDALLEDGMVDFIALKEALTQAGKDFGIPVTAEMENYVMSLSSTLDTSGDALAWFVAAISFQTNMKTLPNMIGLIDDMRAEIKSLQNVNRSLTVTSGDIVKKMTGVKDDILSGFESLRRSVLDKIVAIPTQVEAAVGGHKIEPKVVDKGKGIAVNDKPTPPQGAKREWVKKDQSREVDKEAEAKDIAEATSASLISAKIKYLSKIGVAPSLLAIIPKTVVDRIITSDELMILVEHWDSDEALAAIDEIEMRVIMLENDLLN